MNTSANFMFDQTRKLLCRRFNLLFGHKDIKRPRIDVGLISNFEDTMHIRLSFSAAQSSLQAYLLKHDRRKLKEASNALNEGIRAIEAWAKSSPNKIQHSENLLAHVQASPHAAELMAFMNQPLNIPAINANICALREIIEILDDLANSDNTPSPA